MASRFCTYVSNLIAGQTAGAESVDAKFTEVDTALGLVEGEMNRSIRFTDGTPAESTFQIAQTGPQRANQLLGFDSNGNLALSAAGFDWRGNWATSTFYSVNDVVIAPLANNYSLYVCRTSHTSGTFATDVATGRFQIMVDLTEVRRSLILHELVSGPNTVALTAGQDVMVDVTGGAVTLTLPAAPVITDQPINIMHVGGNVGTFPITIARNGKPIMGLLEDMTVTTSNASFGLAFCNDTFGWRIRGV